MAMIEDAIVNLKVDDSDASSKWLENKEAIKDLNAELRRMKEAGEVGSDGYKEIQRELKDLKAEQKEMLHNVDLTTASINQMQDAVNFWTREAKKAEQGSEEWVNATKKIDEIRPVLNQAQTELRSFGHEVEKQPGFWDSMKVSVLSVFTGLGLFELVKSAAGAMVDFGLGVFETTAKFEKYETVLKTALGTQEAATAAMGDIKKIAAETPFSVDELTDSYIKYVNRGLQPSMEQMTKLGDVASSQGKSFEQLTEAVLDAGTGEFERLKEFGIQAHKNGEIVELSFKGVQKTVANTPEAIQAALISFGDLEGVAGSMADISETLTGRVSNLGDQFDGLNLVLGEILRPVFDWLLQALKDGMEFMGNLLQPTGEFIDSFPILRNVISGVSEVFSALWDVIVGVWEVGKNFVTTIWDMIGGTNEAKTSSATFEKVLEALAFAVRLVGSIFLVAVTAVQTFIEGLNIAQNKAKELANFFGADFKIDTSATWENLSKHANDNFQKINDIWKDTAKDGQKYGEIWVDEDKKQNDEKLKKHTDTTNKKVATTKKGLSDEEKLEIEYNKRIEAMDIRAIADDATRKTKQLTNEYNKQVEWANKEIKNEEKKTTFLKKLEATYLNDIAKINADARKKEEAEAIKAQKEAEKNKKVWLAFVKAIKDQELKDTKALLDAEFIAKIDNAKVSLALAKDGSQAEFEAKKAVLDAELAYKRAKLNAEADAERARIADSISSNETKAQRLKAVEDKLSADLILTEAQTADAKNKIDQAATDEKNRRKEEFYKGLNLAMQGDLNGFIKYLQEKSQKDTKYLDERKAAQLKQANEIGAIMLTAVNTLMDLNKKYTEDKLAKLEIEKKANEAKLKADYEKGIITKEELDEGLLGLQGKFDADSMALKKKEFDRNKRMQIAMSAIQGSMAVLNALATPPWPVGLVMALAAGVKTAIDIKKIKSQQFEGASGGTYFKNAGIARGGRHGSKYGEGGIAMYDRATGAEVGEIEGDEPVMVLSRNTYKNNGPLIERLLHSSLHKNGAPVTLANGGIVPVSDFKYGEMHLFGSKKKKAAARAEMEAAQAEYAAMEAEYDAGADVGIDGETQAMLEQNTKIIEDQLKALEAIEKTAGNMADLLKDHSGILQKIADKDSGAASLMHAIERVQDNISKATLKG